MGLVGNLKSTSCFPEKALISETYMYPQLSNQKSPKFQNHTYMCPAKSGWNWRALGMRASQSSAIGRGQVFNEGYCPRATPKFKKTSQYKIFLRYHICSTEQFYENTVASRQEVFRSLQGMGRQVTFYPHSLKESNTCPILFLLILKQYWY